MTTQEKRKELQRKLLEAKDALAAAQKLADELDSQFDFLGQTYYPRKSVTKEYGGWTHEGGTPVPYDQPDPYWHSSNC